MAIHEEQLFSNGDVVIHFLSPFQKDYALCGQDLAGDSIDERGVYKNTVQTEKKVTCKQCIRMVMYCQLIKRREFI